MPTNIILHQDSFIELRYSPPLDILSFEWPRFDKAERTQIEYSLSKIGEAIRYYIVKRIFIDFSNTQGLFEENIRNLSIDTGKKIKGLQKIGWVTLSNPLLEEKARELCRILFPDIHETQSFPDKSSTVDWLLG